MSQSIVCAIQSLAATNQLILAALGGSPTSSSYEGVTPVVGNTGLVSLAAFTNGQAPFTTALIAPKFTNPLSLFLSAPVSNTGAIYFSQSPYVRALGSTGTYEGPELVTNFDFAGNINGWTPSGYPAWSYSAAGYAKWLAVSSLESISLLSQTIAYVAPGTYKINLVLSALGTDYGTIEFAVIINGFVHIRAGADTIDSVNVYHSGGPMNIGMRVTVLNGDQGTASAEIASLSIKAFYNSLSEVGTPLLPGETVLITSKDMNLTRPIYIVPFIGAAANSQQVIANYNH